MSRERGWCCIGFLVIAGALLFTEHRAHVLGVAHLAAASGLSAHARVHAWRHGHGGHGGHRKPADRERKAP